MTYKTLIKDIAITTAGVSAFTLIALSPILAYAADVTPQSTTATQSVEAEQTALRGTFEGRSKHVTSGQASIVKTATGYDLVLGDDFFLDGAPDPVLGFGSGDTYDAASTFAKLEKKNGRQVYTLPAGFTPANFNQVFVWCEKFAVPLGVATLS